VLPYSCFLRCRMWRIIVLFVAALLSCALVFSQTGSTSGNINGAAKLAPNQPAHSLVPALSALTVQINRGDMLDVTVYGLPDLSAHVHVDSKGTINLPLLGYVRVEGMTVEEVQSTIEQRFVSGGFIKQPHVSVLITESSMGISILGEVTRPGIFPYNSTRRLFDALSEAGGLTPNAGGVITITHASEPDAPILVTYAADPLKAPESNIALQPGDTIFIAKANFVWVVGDVVQPSSFPIGPGPSPTVMEALAMAHGANHTAALGKARILRRTPEGLRDIPLNVSQIMAAKSKDVQLQANDVLFIPVSGAKTALRRGMEAAVSVGTGVAILAVHP
jgi:polysaccharide biosynthesis/export protein